MHSLRTSSSLFYLFTRIHWLIPGFISLCCIPAWAAQAVTPEARPRADTIQTIVEKWRDTGEAAQAPRWEDTLVAQGLRYYPLPPCRLVDTRFASGAYAGPIPSQQSYHFHAKNGAEIPLQGGEEGCEVPTVASALVVNITAAQPGGMGHLRVYRYGEPLPTASTLNFSGNNIANSIILPLCEAGCTFDFSVFAWSSVQVVVDVLGYFAD